MANAVDQSNQGEIASAASVSINGLDILLPLEITENDIVTVSKFLRGDQEFLDQMTIDDRSAMMLGCFIWGIGGDDLERIADDMVAAADKELRPTLLAAGAFITSTVITRIWLSKTYPDSARDVKEVHEELMRAR